jgi:putative phage-type endonuclease
MTTPPITHPATQPQTGLTRETWLAARRQVIAGSDAAAVLGLSKFASPMDVYLDKRGLLPERSDNQAMQSGRRLERPIIEWYAETMPANVVFEPPYYLRRSSIFEHIGATLDAQRFDVEPHHAAGAVARPVDAKNIRFKRESDGWGEPGTDQMPLYYAVQLVLQMHVTGADFADLAVLFSGQDLQYFRLYRDAETEANIVGKCENFYLDHVIRDIPPPVDGSDAYAEYLKKLVKQATQELKPATPELHDVALTLAAVQAEKELIEARETLAENTVKAFIGEAKGAVGSNWRATWTQSKDTMGTDWETVARELMRVHLKVEAEALASHNTPDKVIAALGEVPSFEALVASKQTVTRKGSRRFTFSFKGD